MEGIYYLQWCNDVTSSSCICYVTRRFTSSKIYFKISAPQHQSAGARKSWELLQMQSLPRLWSFITEAKGIIGGCVYRISASSSLRSQSVCKWLYIVFKFMSITVGCLIFCPSLLFKDWKILSTDMQPDQPSLFESISFLYLSRVLGANCLISTWVWDSLFGPGYSPWPHRPSQKAFFAVLVQKMQLYTSVFNEGTPTCQQSSYEKCFHQVWLYLVPSSSSPSFMGVVLFQVFLSTFTWDCLLLAVRNQDFIFLPVPYICEKLMWDLLSGPSIKVD